MYGLLLTAGCEGEADIVFLLDSSSRTNQYDFEQIRGVTRSIVSELDIAMDKTRVGVASITSEGISEFSLQRYYEKQQMMEAILRINFRNQNANFSRALNYVNIEMFSKKSGMRTPELPVPCILVFFISYDMALTINQVVMNATNSLKHNRQITVIGVIYGVPNSDTQNMMDQLDTLVTPYHEPDVHAFVTRSASDTRGQQTDIRDSICTAVPGI